MALPRLRVREDRHVRRYDEIRDHEIRDHEIREDNEDVERYDRGVGPRWYEAYVRRDIPLLEAETEVPQDDVLLSWNANIALLRSYRFPDLQNKSAIQRLYIMKHIRDVPFNEYRRNARVLTCCRLYRDSMLNARTLFRPRISFFLLDKGIVSGATLATYVHDCGVQRIWKNVCVTLAAMNVTTPPVVAAVDRTSFWRSLTSLLQSSFLTEQVSALSWYGFHAPHWRIDNELTAFTGELEPLFPLPHRPTYPNRSAIYSGFCFAILAAYIDLGVVVDGVNLYDELSQLVHNIALSEAWTGHCLDDYESDVQHGQSLGVYLVGKERIPYLSRNEYPGWGHRLLP